MLRHIAREHKFARLIRSKYWHVLHLQLQGFDPTTFLR